MEEDQIKLNEQVLSKDEFKKKKEEIEKNKGMNVIETENNKYKIRIQG